MLPLKHLMEIAAEAAFAGGRRTLAYFDAGMGSAAVETKSDETPVTLADREAEQVIRSVIQKHCPGHAILGEEHGLSAGDAKYTWVVDPIDGTKSFVHGVPLYGAVVGLLIKDEPVVGAVYLPALDEMYCAATGLGATRNGRACRVSGTGALKQATLLAGSITRATARSGAYMELARQVKLNRGWGDVFGYMLVASGRAEIMLDPRISIWDIAGIAPIIREAGGWLGSWDGTATVKGKDCCAVNMALKDTVLGVLAKEG
jgi:histidinol phosphatase-like enzyme (inositol monophosphatase family)